VPRITDICICTRIYVFGCRLSLFRLCDNDFGITPVDDITIGITCTVFRFRIAHILFASIIIILLLLLLVTVQVIPCEKIFLEKLTVAQPINEYRI